MCAMTALLAETFPSFHFEGDHLVTFHLIEDLGFDDGFHVFAHGQVVTMGKEHFAELDLITGIARDAGNV